MGEWTDGELSRIGRAEEVQIVSVRRDGSLRKPVTVWAVRQGDDVYLRSVKGRDSAWFHGVQEKHQGRISAGGIQKDVTFVDADHELEADVDAAYQAKYRRYAGPILNSCLTPAARSATVKLVPR